jgi:hypothetical protein
LSCEGRSLEKKMKRKNNWLYITMMALVLMSCSNPSTTPTDSTITQLAIPGVVAPVRGATPVTTAIDTAQYTGTITWAPAASTFAASTVHTANIVLTAKAGYTLTGVAANSFTVAGATTTNAANEGTVTAVFPATGVPSDTDVTFSGVAQAGGASNSASTTSLTLTFSADPATLAASDITVTGATKGALIGSGTTRSLAISDITVADGATVSVAVASPAGYAITGSPKTAVVYKKLYAVGDTGPSGVGKVFYITDAGMHGLEVAPETWYGGTYGPTFQWKTMNTDTPGTLDAIGTGYANTYTYMTGAEHPAAAICREYKGGGKSDWFLPSIEELRQLYIQRAVIGNLGGDYWSSTQYDSTIARVFTFTNGGTAACTKDCSDLIFVRPVRAF